MSNVSSSGVQVQPRVFEMSLLDYRSGALINEKNAEIAV